MKSGLSFKEELVGAQDELFRFAFKLTANYDDASDLLQETSLKALNNEAKYRLDTNFRGWLYAIMRNIFINNYRRIVSEHTYTDSSNNQYCLGMASDSDYADGERAYDLKEMRDIVRSLPKEYRRPFMMYVSGFKYREISEKLSVPIGTVKSRLFFTRRKLQELLKDFR